MKKIYERPVLMAEEYKTNAYCGSCDMTKNGFLVTDADRAYGSDRKTAWTGSSSFPSIKAADLHHFFDPSKKTNTEGSCGMYGSGYGHDNTQFVIPCECHPGNPWYLEFSHYYSVHQNGFKGTDTYFLYKEAYDSTGFNIVDQGGNYPYQNANGQSDINVAMVRYQTYNVVNS